MLIVLLMAISKILKPQNHNLKEKITPFECGFDPNHIIRIPFSLRFFILTIVFLIFDIEIIVILTAPLCNRRQFSNSWTWNTVIWALLTLGLIFEWKQGALRWIWLSNYNTIIFNLQLKIANRPKPKTSKKKSVISTYITAQSPYF